MTRPTPSTFDTRLALRRLVREVWALADRPTTAPSTPPPPPPPVAVRQSAVWAAAGGAPGVTSGGHVARVMAGAGRARPAGGCRC